MGLAFPVRSLPEIVRSPNGAVDVPHYNLKDVQIGVVHLGCGAFHRAHQAIYFDDILNTGDLSWGISSVCWHSAVTRDNLRQQDNLYTVLTNDSSAKPRIVGAIREMLVAPENPEAVLSRMAHPNTKLITLTITQKGYCCNMSDRTLLLDDAAVKNDIQNPTHPQTAIGYLVEAFARRKAAGLSGLSVLSCDNFPDNGDLTAKLVHDMVGARDPALAAWIEKNVTFPNTLVDRITPTYQEAYRQMLDEKYGLDCHAPVFAEAFNQWVIEDKFISGSKPPLEKIGVQLVDNVKPYELMKLRLLNGTHMAIAYLGMMAGFTKVGDLMANPDFSRFVRKFLDEVGQTIPSIPGFDTVAYKRSVVHRLSTVDDEVERLGRDGSAKLQGRILPSIADALRQGTPIEAMTYAVAGWMRYVEGHSEAGEVHPVIDPNANRLQVIARIYGEDPSGLLGEAAIFGHELPQNPRFRRSLESALGNIYEKGVRPSLHTLDNRDGAITSLRQMPVPTSSQWEPSPAYG